MRKVNLLKSVVISSFILISLNTVTSNVSAASYTYPTATWYKPTDPNIDKSYAPETGSAWFVEEVNDSTGYRYLKPMIIWKYNKAQINAINDYYNDRVPGINCFKDRCYPGMDISITDDYNTTVNAVKANLISNLPNPYYDVDDDKNNGYNDESEVSSLRPDLMTAMPKEYTFASFYEVVNNNKPVTFEFNAIESDDWYDGSKELQTVRVQLLHSRNLYN
ncbi:hypothetical protein [Paenibacillus lutrae]|uniref:Uncharacterized protein n=1 Tax=Paenibacillus lutrae TaxID=2078573 RepID=A0A7X3FHK7_9BACL|nr:hypothetical protein [Paenibacillus lutrae]MVO99923.1 hypothetical protein [Paenibacillus lutrae]